MQVLMVAFYIYTLIVVLIWIKAIEYNTIDECQRCGEDIPWCEMFEALDNGGYCSYCQHVMEKMNEE